METLAGPPATNDATPPVARFEWVTFAYPRGKPILTDTTWEAPRTSGFVVIRGRSGSGKTTLLALMSGLLTPGSGTVTTLGIDVSARPNAERRAFRRSSIGHVFQDFKLLPELVAWENVALPLWLQGEGGDAARQRARAALTDVDLDWAVERRPDRLSGGEQQRVALARAIVTRPRLILADEPTANLDAESASSIELLLRELAGHGTAVVLASHDERVFRTGDVVFELADGQLRPQGTLPRAERRLASWAPEEPN